jgi:hypothetical protein
MKSNLLQHLDQIPPCIARLCARRKAKAKSLREIAKDAGLSYQVTNWIALQPTWEHVSVGDALRFADGCGLDLLRPRKKLFYLRRAWSRDGLKTIGRGLTQGYVTQQIRIRSDYEDSGKAPKTIGRPRKAKPIIQGNPEPAGSHSGS